MNENVFRNAYADSNFVINKKLLRELGGDKTCFLHMLINEEPKWTPKQAIETDGWFYFKASDIKAALCLTDESKAELERNMVEDGLLETRPVKDSNDLCYRLNWDHIQEVLGR